MADKSGANFVRDGHKPFGKQTTDRTTKSEPKTEGQLPNPQQLQDAAREKLKRARNGQ